jgi:hypothetical protein
MRAHLKTAACYQVINHSEATTKTKKSRNIMELRIISIVFSRYTRPNVAMYRENSVAAIPLLLLLSQCQA